jgi:short-subunit dehydrogenase
MAVARRFGREGFRLALLARRAEALDGYVAELAQEGIAAQGFTADAADAESLRQALGQVEAQLAPPDVLVYNAAVLRESVPSALDAALLLDDMRVNVAGALVAAQAVLPQMRARQRGTILLTGGGLALSPAPPYAALAAGKAALRNLCYSLGAEVESEGVHVAMVTIAGFVQPGSHFDPDRIAEAYWTLHTQAPGQWEREIVYQ